MAPQKAAKKSVAKDARRAFEHLGRVQSIATLASAEAAMLTTLVTTADTAFQSQRYEDSANLLRAAEHLAFAAIVKTKPGQISPSLVQALQEEFHHLVERTEEHERDSADAIERIYARMKAGAASAMRHHDYRRALELARGAEALTHIEALDYKLPAGVDGRKKLPA